MGDPVVKVVDGQEVKFCCKSCIPDFEKEPAKFLTKLAAK
jgi:YHS domain-containing protein